MHTRGLARAFLALVGTALIASTVQGAPAHAVDQSISVACSQGQGVRFIYNVSAQPGDVINVAYSGCSWVRGGGPRVAASGGNVTFEGNAIPKAGSVRLTIGADPSGQTNNVSVVACFFVANPSVDDSDFTCLVAEEAPPSTPVAPPGPSSECRRPGALFKPHSYRQVIPNPESSGQPTAYFLDETGDQLYGVAVCAGMADGSVRTVARPSTPRGINSTGMVPVPAGYANAGTVYVSSRQGLWAIGSDSAVTWQLPGEFRTVVGIVPIGQPGAGGPLLWAGSGGMAARDPSGVVIRDPGGSPWTPQYTTQIPDGSPGSGTVYALEEPGVQCRAQSCTVGRWRMWIATAAGSVRSVPMPKLFARWGNTGPIIAAPAETPTAGSVFGITTNGNRCWVYKVNLAGTTVGSWEYTLHFKDGNGKPLTRCTWDSTTELAVGRAATPTAGTLFFARGWDILAVTPTNKLHIVHTGMKWNRNLGPVDLIWSVPAPSGGLVALAGSSTKLAHLVLPSDRLVLQ